MSADDPARHAALYDPDTVYPPDIARPAGEKAASVPGAPTTNSEPGPRANGERRVRPGAMTPEMIKRIADRTELNARKRGAK